MTFHGRVSGTRIKRALGVQAALEWAFRIEQAQLDLPLPPDITEEGFGFGLEYVLLQRAVLGCKIDGGQHKIGGYTHEDAEVIAATVAGIPDIRDLRALLEGIRLMRRTAAQTVIRMLTAGLILTLLAGIALKLKLFGDGG